MINLMVRGVIFVEYVYKFYFLSNVLELEIFLLMVLEKLYYYYVMMFCIFEELVCSIYYFIEWSIFFFI